ncbi:thiamine biosynthesis protein ThiF [Cellulomonas sp. APG4]|uniref:ThiF family adenylyltransferase n=1 Tax=Cellulomonas sp. APG4 TaxID=1538656 RepID=UPI001379F548|nr:ThiF family adenylyltransferase [Cellulomonas sp. APG4]NCT89536.1 thiamine biosynthesis protein ThiF [Cellulomonas sp. APG4]
MRATPATEPGTTSRSRARTAGRSRTRDDARRLRPGLAVLWRSLTEVQIGTDPRWATAFTDLSPSATRALHSLSPGADVRTVRAALAAERVAADEAEELVTGFGRAGLLTDPPTTSVTGALVADATAWGLASTPRVVLDRRRHAVVVRGLGRTGAVVATTLASAGVRRIALEDDALVAAHDTGVGGLTARDVGTDRSGAVARLLHDAAPGVRTSPLGDGRADLVVLVEAGTPDPVLYRTLLTDGVPHLSVVLREASVLVGPLVVPGRTACLGCADLHRSDEDPAWPAVAAQLVARGARTGDAVESTLAAVAGGLATAQALAHLDGRAASTEDAALEVRLPDAVPRLVRLPPHPECGCLDLRDPTAADPSGHD